MTRFLLDIDVLIALIDPAHVQHNFTQVGVQKTAANLSDRAGPTFFQHFAPKYRLSRP